MPSGNDIAEESTFKRHGRGGHSGLTTPSALSKVASQHFLDAQPPLLSEEGVLTFIPTIPYFLSLSFSHVPHGRGSVASQNNGSPGRRSLSLP